MGSSGIITIFDEPQRVSFYPSPFVVSILIHVSMFSLLTIRMIEKTRIIERFPTDRYSLRVLDFHSTEPQAGPTASPAAGSISYRGPLSPSKSTQSRKPAGTQTAKGNHPSGPPSMTRETAQMMPAPQTLIQPDLPRDVLIPLKTPVPLVVMWSPEKAVIKKVVPPAPDKAAVAVVRPSLDIPIAEENLADMRISPTPFLTMTPAALPGTTSPIVVHGPEEVKKVPQTTSKQADPPTPGRVLSLSDIRVPEGKVVIPIANETSPERSVGAMIPGQLKSQPQAGAGTAPRKSAETGAGKGEGQHPGAGEDNSANAGKGEDTHGKANLAGSSTKAATAAPGHIDKPAPVAKAVASASTPSVIQPKPQLPIAQAAQIASTRPQAGPAVSSAQGSQGVTAGLAAGSGLSTAHISLPRDGQFGVVVVGSSIADKYPETAELWSGRMGATVYLRVGLAKSWILQYTLPRLTEAATVGGGRLEAPWPYEIVRPNIDPGDVDSDAIILHGYVNKDGHFEKLEVVFPVPLAQAPSVVTVLNQWQFRPAKQDGVFAAVEVLLIIPDQSI